MAVAVAVLRTGFLRSLVRTPPARSYCAESGPKMPRMALKARLFRSLKEEGDLDNALVGYNKAIELNPNFAAAYSNRGLVKKAKSDFEGARLILIKQLISNRI